MIKGMPSLMQPDTQNNITQKKNGIHGWKTRRVRKEDT